MFEEASFWSNRVSGGEIGGGAVVRGGAREGAKEVVKTGAAGVLWLIDVVCVARERVGCS